MAFESPNYTQTPNDLFDTILSDIGYAELKVTLAIIRITVGFHRHRVSASIPKIMRMTGLSRQAVVDGATRAEARGTIRRLIGGGGDNTVWDILTDLPHLDTRGVPLQQLEAPPLDTRGGPLQQLEAPPLDTRGLLNKGLNKPSKKTKSNKLLPPTPLGDGERSPKESEAGVGGVGVNCLLGSDGYEWPIVKICQAAGQSPFISNDKDELINFMSYWLYAHTQKAINNPVAYAKANAGKGYRASEIFRAIVEAGPLELLKSIKHENFRKYADPTPPSDINATALEISTSGALGELKPLLDIQEDQLPPITTITTTITDITEYDDDDETEETTIEPHQSIYHPLNGKTQTPKLAWEAAKEQIRLEMPRAAFETRLMDAELFDYSDGEFVVLAASQFSADYLSDRLAHSFNRLLTGITNSDSQIKFITAQQIDPEE